MSRIYLEMNINNCNKSPQKCSQENYDQAILCNNLSCIENIFKQQRNGLQYQIGKYNWLASQPAIVNTIKVN